MKSVFCNNENTLKLEEDVFIIKSEMLPDCINKTKDLITQSNWKGFYKIDYCNLRNLLFFVYQDVKHKKEEYKCSDLELLQICNDLVFDIIYFNSYMIGDMAGYRHFEEIVKDYLTLRDSGETI